MYVFSIGFLFIITASLIAHPINVISYVYVLLHSHVIV